jgi:hypothetical protein
MVNINNVLWLAGLLEGEGSFALYNGSPCIQMGTTDYDVAEKAALVLKTTIGGPYQPKRKPGAVGKPYKPFFNVRVHGAKAIGWMFMLFSFLGERRREAIQNAVGAWKSRPRRPNGQMWKEGRSRAGCHPERIMRAKGLCNLCYMKRRRANLGAIYV